MKNSTATMTSKRGLTQSDMPGSEPAPIHSSHSYDASPDVSLNQFTVRFWGVRGNIPTPGKETVRYGGNTACVELQVGGKRLIFDGGSGLRSLGKSLIPHMPMEAYLFFTHTHWDRIQGFPFFIPAFIEGNCFHIYGATGLNGASIKQRLAEQMLRPNFPVPFQVMRSEMHFHNISPGSVITLDDVVIEAMSLNRPNSALGYRITWNGHSVVYATDTEYTPDRIDPSLVYLAQQADLLIFDAVHINYDYYSLEALQKAQKPDAWKASIEMAIAAKAKQIVAFHHDPMHDDDFLDEIEMEMRSSYPNVWLAREGAELQISS